MAVQNNANIGFEKQIWDAACVLWGHIPAAEYRKVIVGLIFLRYISSAFEKRYQQLVEEGDGFEDDKDAYAEDNIFFVPEDARWSKIASAAHTPEIGTVIDDAMRAIEKENTTLKNVLPKNYASPDLDKRVLGEVEVIAYGWRRGMLKVKFYDSVDDSLLKFAVIVSQSNGKWVFCKHKGRDTYEVPGGHREPEESILETARRELQEETGAVKFEIKPICVYSVTGKTRVNATGEETFGLLCFAEISEFAKELHSEMEKVVLMDELPENWTYPLIQPKLIEKYLEIKKLCGQNRGY